MAAIHREVVAHFLKFQRNTALRGQRLAVLYKDASEATLWRRCFVEVAIENVDFLELETFLNGGRTEGGSYGVVVLNNCLNSVMRRSGDGDEFDVDKLAELLKALLYMLEHDGLVLCRQNLDSFRQRFATANLTDVFDQYKSKLDGKTLGFKFLALESLQASVHSCQNWMDLLWCLKKAEFPVDEPVCRITDRNFLDKNQYATAGIAAYEWIFGENFISPGGAEKNLEFLNKLSLRPGARLLDIGCGIGGTLFQAAKEFGVYTHGIDLSSNMVSLAYEKANKIKDTRISLVVGDVLSYEFQASSFDAVYSRDCVQHIPNAEQLFGRCYSWLKPGGKMLFTSYMLGRGSPSGQFNDYVDQRRYTLLPFDEFAQIMENAGFCNVAATDLTKQLKMITEKEVRKTTDNSAEFNKLFTEKRYEQLVFGWAAKLGFIDSANLVWGVIYAEKPPI